MPPSEPVRKTLGIVFCDIVSFSDLIADAGDLVAANMLRVFYERAGRLGKEHCCLTMKFIGDGFLATFEGLEDAVELVKSIERLLIDDPTLAAQHLACKFTLHYGDVIYVETSYGPDVLAEQINVAAHLTDVGLPHQLIVSQAALDRLPADFRSHAGPSESMALKRGGSVDFRRVDLTVA